MRFKVYYLDDEPALLELFADHFESPEVEIRTFLDPKELLDAVKSSPPDLVFLDYRLPNTNGDLVAKALDRSLPKVLMTGDLTIKVESDFVEIFHKPYQLDAVRTFIERLLLMKKTA